MVIENKLISIVVPVYNVSRYIVKCLNSIMNQKYSRFEVIIVDDGSTDNSLALCKDFENQDSRFQVFHKQNGGLSSARNYGLKHVKGDYITFIDSDDFIHENYLYELYTNIEKYQSDISICTYYIYYDDKKMFSFSRQKNYFTYEMDAQDCLKNMLVENGYSVSAWGKLYKTSLFNDVYFPEGKICEDNGTTYKIISKADKIIYINSPLYYYYKRPGSIMLSVFSYKKLDMISLTDEMCDYLDKYYPSLNEISLLRRVYSRFNVLRQIPKDKKYNSLKKELKAYILKNKKIVYKSKYSSFRLKCAVFILKFFGLNGFYVAWNLMNKKR